MPHALRAACSVGSAMDAARAIVEQRPSSTPSSTRCGSAATRSSGPRCARSRSSTTSCAAPTTCRPAGSTSRRAAPSACSAATTARSSPTPSATTRSSASCSRRSCASGAHGAARRRARGRGSPSRRRATRSSACARATCTRSRSRTASSSGDRYVDPDYEARRARRVLRRRQLRAAPAARASARRWAPGPRADRRLRPGADRAARRRRPPLRRRGRQRARRRGARASSTHARAAPADERRAPDAAAERAPRRRWAARSTPTDIRDLLLRQPRAPALGRGRRPLPELRQLHAGLPDLLLQHGRGRHRPGRRARPSARACGTRASRSSTPTSTAAACAQHRPLALPPVDDPQARDLDRPVRHLGLRRLRALHHLVPGGDRHHRGGRGDPRDDCEAAMQTIEELLAEVPALAGAGARAPRADRRLRAQPRLPAPASAHARGRAGGRLLRHPRGRGRARDRRPAAAAPVIDRDAARRRPARLVVARAALPHRVRRARARARRTRSRSTAPACAASARPTRRSATTC